jgi:hypothetical protein
MCSVNLWKSELDGLSAAIPNVAPRRHSSFNRLVRLAIYPEDWADDVSSDGGDYGERPEGRAAR